MKERWRALFAFLRRHRVKVLMLALLLCLLGFGTYQAGCYFYAERHLRAAEEATARYEFDDAAEHLAACLRVRPRSAALQFQMARALRRAGRYDEALVHLERCQQLEGRTPENALEGLLLRAQWGQVAEVEGLLQEKVDHGSLESAQILEALAQGYINNYRLDEAVYCLNRLLEREPDNVQALLWRASLWQRSGAHGKAEADFRRAIEAQPDHFLARCRFGEFYLLRKQGEDALRQYEHLRQGPRGDRPEVLLGLARSHLLLGHADTTRQLLDELLARHPDHGQALIERGQLALESESPAAAEGWLRRALAEYPLDWKGNYLLAQSLRRQDKDDEARRYDEISNRIGTDMLELEAAFERVTKAPRDPQPRLEAGRICLRNGQESEGERWLLSALDVAPNHEPTRAALADYYERTGKTDEAERLRSPAEQLDLGKLLRPISPRRTPSVQDRSEGTGRW